MTAGEEPRRDGRVARRQGTRQVIMTAALEAFAQGTAVIASRMGGVPEIVKEGVDGLLVPPGDAGALARAISALCADHGLAERLGRAAARAAARDFSEERYARDLEAVYRDALRQ